MNKQNREDYQEQTAVMGRTYGKKSVDEYKAQRRRYDAKTLSKQEYLDKHGSMPDKEVGRSHKGLPKLKKQ